MEVRAACVQEMRERPDDDLPRLVLADWFDENGDPDRAEFSRAQVKLSRMPRDDPSRMALKARAKDLLARHRERWLAEAGFSRPVSHRFRRGFLDHVWVNEEDLSSHDQTPWLREPLTKLSVHVQRPPLVKRLWTHPAFAHLRWLHLSGEGVAGEGVPGLAASPMFGALRTLVLNVQGLGDREMRVLARCANMPALSALKFHPDWVTEAGWDALASGPLFATLRALWLNDFLCVDDSADQAAAVIAGLPQMRGLRHLSITSSWLMDDGARALAGSDHLGGLRELVLCDNVLTDEGARALLCPRLGGLEVLDLRSNMEVDLGDALPERPRVYILKRGGRSYDDEIQRGLRILRFGDDEGP